jgi:NADH-quinone oxidoreductase subunit D
MPLKTESFVINIGPAHMSTHGVFRMRTVMDGEVIVDMEPVFGYLHRGLEKLAEQRTYTGIIPLTDRMDYTASMNNNLAHALAVEKLADIKVPERAEYLRVIMVELQRICAHFLAIGAFVNDCGAMGTPMFYMFREREKIFDLFEMASGQRLTYNYIRPGGVAQDVPAEFMPALQKLLGQMHGYIDDYDNLISTNEILLARSKGIGILSKESAINYSAGGPILRASSLKWDIRRVDPYSIYDRFEFEIPTASNGDCYDRYWVRLQEIKQCVRIIEQAVEQMPVSGETRTPVPALIRPPAGEAYVRVESPKGEMGFYIVSDNSIAPYRYHVRAPCFINLSALRDLVIGWKIADAIVIFGSIDICMGEVDR